MTKPAACMACSRVTMQRVASLQGPTLGISRGISRSGSFSWSTIHWMACSMLLVPEKYSALVALRRQVHVQIDHA